jgi:hypothetical protein
MIKKRAMAAGRQFGKMHTSMLIDVLADLKRIDTGYADNQPNWPYWVQPQYYTATDWYNIHKWMQATFGDSNWADKGLWVGSDRKYWFRNEGDRTLFLLKWA